MPLDVDIIAARQSLERLERLASSLPHMGREDIADDILEFENKMKEKYGNKDKIFNNAIRNNIQ